MTTYPLGIAFLIKLETSPGVFATIANAKSHHCNVNNAEIDVSDKDGSGFRTLISGGMRSIDMGVDGIFTDAATLKSMFALVSSNNPIANFQLVDGLGNILQGPFHVGQFVRKGDVFKEQTYSFTLKSAAAITTTLA